MTKDEELAVVRRAYAKQVLAVVEVEDERLAAAFAAVPRRAGVWLTSEAGGPAPPGRR